MQRENENIFICSLIAELENSLEMIATIPADLYREGGKGSIGVHVRHNLDFVNALVRGVSVGSVDYADRERDPRIESDQRYAAWKIRSAIASIAAGHGVDPGALITVRSEAHPHVRHRSSFSRELEFVYTHMVHHHALIKERLAGYGISLPSGFGVAPATQAYWDGFKIAA